MSARHVEQLRSAGAALSSLCGFKTRHYPAEAVISRQGEGAARTFLIETGWGLVHRDLPNGSRQVVEIPISGDLVGQFTNLAARHEDFSALTDIKVWEGPANAFVGALQLSSPVAALFSVTLARQRSLLGERIADLGQRGAAVRATHFLLELGVRLERIGAGARNRFECPLTQAVMADTLGLTAIHLNRILRETREAGLFQFRRGSVEFIDYRAAVGFADFDPTYILS